MSGTPQLELGLAAVGRYDGRTVSELPTVLPSYRLTDRLRRLGLPAAIPIETHANRRVLVSLTTRGALRVHQGYAMAPDEVVRAIAQWAEPRTPRAARRRAQQVLTGFPVHAHVPPAREARRLREPARPGDERILGRLHALFDQLNARHFGGALGAATLGLSGRMRRKLGEFRPADTPGAPHEITLSRRHLRRDGWSAAAETLAHEMVHQWQVETGRRLGHDVAFRERCAAMGIDPRAVRLVDDLRRSA